MSTIVVTPPAAAALVAVVNPSLINSGVKLSIDQVIAYERQ